MDLQKLLNDSAFLSKVLGSEEMITKFKEEVSKAAEVKTTYTFDPSARSVFSPENLEEEIKLLVPTDTPLRNRIPRVRGYGEAVGWKTLTSKLHVTPGNQGVGTNTSITFADAGTPNETQQTYNHLTAAFKLLGRRLEVGGLANAASQGRDGQPSMFESRRRVKMMEVMLGEEELIIAGNSSNNALEFDGLLKQIVTNSGNAALLTASGIGRYCQTAFYLGADFTSLVASPVQLGALANSLGVTNGIHRVTVGNQSDVTAGLRLTKIVNPVTGSLIDALPSRYIGGNALLLTEKSPAGEQYIEMTDLIPMSQVDVPVSTFSVAGFIVEATVMKLYAELYQFAIGGLSINTQ